MASNSKSSKYEIELKNHAALEHLAKKLQPLVIDPEVPTPPPISSDFFSRLNVASKIEINTGDYFNIDVQPDSRFSIHYSIYNTVRTYPDLDVRRHPYVSPFTLIAYEQMLFTAQLLLNDIHHTVHRPPPLQISSELITMRITFTNV